jgi:hypothetical protein
VSLFEDIGVDHQIFTGHPLDRVATAIDQRLQIFNDRAWKCPKHGRSIKRISVKGKSPDAPSCRTAIFAAIAFSLAAKIAALQFLFGSVMPRMPYAAK